MIGKPPGAADPDTVGPSADDSVAGPSSGTVAVPAVGHTGRTGCANAGCVIGESLRGIADVGTDGS